MKKFLAVLLAIALFSCSAIAMAESVKPDDIADTMTSDDGTYELAFVTDVGQLKDKSFNQGTWNGVKGYAAANGKTYKYYQPANGDQATDDDRFDAMKAAAEAGAKVVVCAGFMQGTALTKAAIAFPDVNFVFIDGWPLTDEAGNVLTNVAPIAFKEEQCGYFAGYAVVSEGYEKLGFSGGGGGTNAACNRYGYGFVQGANDAAKALNKSVEVRYTWQYGASFQPSSELQTMISGWYETGTEIVFSCGGSIFDSITAAASANDGAVIGVDVDQSFDSDTVVTSALKGITEAANWAIAKYYEGAWADIGGIPMSLGVNDNAVGLPVDTWALETYTVEDYQKLFEMVKNGEVVIDDADVPEGTIATIEFSNVTVQYE